MLDLSRLLDSNSRAACGQLTTTAQERLFHLARFRKTRVVDNGALALTLWDLAEDLSISAGDLRKQLVVNDGASDGLFCHWDDTTGMQIWRLLTAIEAASEGVEAVCYGFLILSWPVVVWNLGAIPNRQRADDPLTGGPGQYRQRAHPECLRT